jgi:hypothetical protein
MKFRESCIRSAATTLATTMATTVALILAEAAWAEGPELVQSPPMKYSVEPTVTGMAGEVKPQWLNATGVVGGNQYRLVIYADAAYVDMVVTQSSGAKCSVKRFKSANADGAGAEQSRAAGRRGITDDAPGAVAGHAVCVPVQRGSDRFVHRVAAGELTLQSY